MALTAPQLRQVRNAVADDLARAGPVGLTKPELLAAVQGIDDYLEANASAMNLAIPQPARGVLTAPLKAALLSAVALARWSG